MTALSRHVHLQTNVKWAPLEHVAPDVTLSGPDGAPVEMMALAFVDPDGETHVYTFDDQGRENLLRQITGGIIIPNGNGVVQ